MKNFYIFLFIFFSALFFSCTTKTGDDKINEEELREKAKELAHKFLIIDTHIDVPYRLEDEWEDISQRTEKGHFDYVRAKQGGLDAAFMSIYVPAKYEETGGGKKLADQLIEMVYRITEDNPDKFQPANSVADVTANFKKGVISFPMGMENGTGIERDLKNLRYFYDKGIRYITLAHSKNNHICDSSYDDNPQWNGLSPFGRKVVAEMNRLGMMVDVSHVTDSTFYDVIEISQAPVIASHSSCRYYTPGWQRNMPDDMIKTLAEHNGVIMINFGSSFINGKVREANSKQWDEIDHWLVEHNLSMSDSAAKKYIDEYFAKHPSGKVDVSEVADHIDHVVKIAGINFVGFGSDFDGVRSVPEGLSDVSMYPNLIYELLKRGYSEENIQKICSGNLLRVWNEVEQTAERLQLIED